MTDSVTRPAWADGPEVSQEAVVVNRFGLHARPAALIVKTALDFRSEIILEKDGVEASARSIMALLTLEGQPGSVFRIRARGVDAEEASAAVSDLFKKKFFED